LIIFTFRFMVKTTTVALLVAALLMFTYSADTDFCVTHKSSDVFPLLSDERHIVPLGQYVRGYNLEFSTSDDSIAKVWNPLQPISTSTEAF
jgi:hypothetical protein